MALEIRPYAAEEADAFYRVPAIVFGSYTGKPRDPAHDLIPPEWSLCAFEDGELATTYAAYPMVQRINGGKSAVAGVTFVGTLPQFRRRGHLRTITEMDFRRRYEQRMEPIAILTASIAGIYQRFGYAVCTTSTRYAIDPRWINFAPSLAPAPGAFREGSPDELPLLERLYRQFTGPRNGYLHRAPSLWAMQTLGSMPDPNAHAPGASVISIYEEGGEPKGYVAWAARWMPSWHLDNHGPGQRVFVRDFVYLTPGAYRAMWEMLRTFDLAASIVVDNAATDDPAPHILLDPRELHATTRDWVLGRIIDIERALPVRPYGADARLVFAVRDAMCPWNDGVWALETGNDGRSAVSRAKETPELSMDVATLVQLLYGQISPSAAVRYGRAEATALVDLRRWDDVWRVAHAPHCSNMF